MLKHRLISIFYNRPKQMFLPEVSLSVLKRFSVYFSKVEAVSASVRDSKIRYQLHRQLSVITNSLFRYIWMQKLNWKLLLAFGISFPWSVWATFAG